MDIRKILSTNIYAYDSLLRTVNSKFNSDILEFTQRISKIDSILDFPAFCEEMKNLPPLTMGTSYTVKCANGENSLYGYATQLLNYAGLTKKEELYIPIVDHGVPYGDDYDKARYPKKNSYIFQGRYVQPRWSQNRKDKAYYVGPYVHYCDPIYSEETMKKLKKKYGSSVLIFLPHSWETNRIFFNIDTIVKRYEQLSQDTVDTIFVCVYCQDADIVQPLVNNNENIRFVSAGFKTDDAFVKRLKTILMLVDSVFYTSMSTSIGYAHYLNKKIICDISDEELASTKQKIGEEGFNKLLKFKNAFENCHSNEQQKKEFVDYYWGLSEVKTPEQVKNIILENKKRIQSHMGFSL